MNVKAVTPVTECDDELAIHDIGALRAGTLHRAGLERLAHHLSRCEACRILIAALVADSQRAEWTGKHDALSRRGRK
jgi:hypothetical protein